LVREMNEVSFKICNFYLKHFSTWYLYNEIQGEVADVCAV